MATVKETMKAVSNRIRAKRLIKEYLNTDTVGTKTGGNILCRWGYFYRRGKTVESYVTIIKELLAKHSIPCSIVDSGDRWKNFSGGSSVAQASHFYVEIRIGY